MSQSTTTTVNIEGVDKLQLLRYLWKMQPSESMFNCDVPEVFDAVGSVEALRGYIDDYNGRSIKSDLSGNTAVSSHYDESAGSGIFARAVELARTASSK